MCVCWGPLGSGAWPLVFSFLLGAVSSRFESRKNTGELEAGLGIEEDAPLFSRKQLLFTGRIQGSVGVVVCAHASMRVCTCVRALGEKAGVQVERELYPG